MAYVIVLRGPVKTKDSTPKKPEVEANVPLYAVAAYAKPGAAADARAKMMGDRTAKDITEGYAYQVVEALAAHDMGLGARPDGKSLAEVLAGV